MKKIMIFAFTVVLVFSMTGCSKVLNKVGKKIEEKAEEKIDKVIEKVDDEAGIDEDDKEKVEKKEKKEKKDKKEKKSKKGKKNKQNKKSEKEKFDFDDFIDNADLSLEGRDLIEEVEPMFNNMVSKDGESVHVYLLEYSEEDGETYMDFYIDGDNLYMSYDNVDSDENDMLTIINADKNATYIAMGDGTGYELPFDPSQIGSSEDSINFGFTEEDLDSVTEAYVEEFEGETCVYIKSNEDGYLSNAWFSLERYCPVYQEQLDNDDNVVFSTQMIEFERGGDFSDIFEKPDDIEWLSIGDMFSDVLENSEETDD